MKRSTGNVVAGLLVLFAAAAGIGWLLWEHCGLHGCPDLERLSGFVPDEASVIVDRNDREVAKLYRVHRVVIPLDSLPPYVPAAFVAVEDRRFWEHDGVDWPRVIGAAWANLRALGIEEGFSTITMQLARNVFPEQLPLRERTLSRKLAEMRVAKEIEHRYTKRQILELYLNQIYFGDGAWGIEAAAQEYFGESATELTLSEAALLAGLIRAPGRLSPRRHPRDALARRAVVLREMALQRVVTRADAARAASAPLVLGRGRAGSTGRAPYFVEETRRELEERFGSAIYTGGYRIHTTVDPAVQEAAEAELDRQLAAIEAGRYGHFLGPDSAAHAGDATARARYLQGAVVVLDAATGDVLAMVGGRDFADSKFNRAVQARRQPGSAFKPFVYAAALAAGYPPTYPLPDVPLRRVLANGSVWMPSNFGGGYAGLVTLRDALVDSRNVATIRLAELVGLDTIIQLAARLGLDGPIPRVPSIAIGAAEVTLLRLVAAYAAFATLGVRPEPRLVTRVEDRNGRIVWSNPPSTRRVLDPGVAFLTTDLMRDVVDRGTGTAVRAVGFRGPAAGKTGTTNEASDVWFVGFTPDRVAGVWIGFDRPRQIVPGATGGRLAAPVWGRIMRRIAGRPARDWTPPPGVETRLIDAAGNVLAPWCGVYGAARREYFLAGTAPPPSCVLGLYPIWPDSLWSDSGAPDLLGVPAERAREGPWWHRLRQRIFGPPHPDEPESVPGGAPRDRDSARSHAGAGADSAGAARAPRRRPGGDPPGLLGRPARPAPRPVPRPAPPDTSPAHR